METRQDKAVLLRHSVCWIVPAVVSAALVMAYFSGIGLLRDIVAPPSNRELGLLEHLQCAILLITAVGGVTGFRRAASGVDKAVCLLIALGAAFLLLEEMDYGLHYWEFLFGETGLQTFNVHNQDDNLLIVKKSSDILVIVLFVIVPLAAWRVTDPRILYFVPDRMIATTVLAGFLVSMLAHALDDAGLYRNGPLVHNVSEFRETFTYYIFMLCCLDLALYRRWPASSWAPAKPLQRRQTGALQAKGGEG